MKKVVCFLPALLPFLICAQSSSYFQQKVDFDITVQLHPADKTLDGFAVIDYQNNSPDTLHYIWFHLWPNAYKNDKTAFSEQLLKSGRTDFYFSDEYQRGYINKLNFTAGGETAILEDHPLYIDVGRLILPNPLPPGERVRIETPFHVRLPAIFSRSGYADDFFMVAQWYPKPAVYDRSGWHPMPYLDQGEFYSEFGSYKIHITVPTAYDLAATGRQTQAETTGGLKRISFQQDSIHDFAWFAARGLHTASREVKSHDGRNILLQVHYSTDEEGIWQNALDHVEESLRYLEHNVGDYPYSNISVVQVPPPFQGGMEYPTITAIEMTSNDEFLKNVIFHEVAHNWFYGVLATNERDFPWMDEGMTSFYTKRFSSSSAPNEKTSFIERRMPRDDDAFFYRYLAAEKLDQPISTASAELSEANYYAIIYDKAALWMEKLAATLGEETFREVMRTYSERWKFKHPYPEDFQKVVEEVSGRDMDSVFSLLDAKGALHPPQKRPLRLRPFFDLRNTDKNNYIFFGPAFGVNKYDGLMAGVFLHNYTLPQPPLHFFVAPMFGTQSGDFSGIGRIGYVVRSYGKIRRSELSLSAAHFNMRRFIDSTGKKNFMPFTKLVPAMRLTFRNNDPRSQSTKYLQWKTYFIDETSLRFTRDTVHEIDVITYPKFHRYMNELSFVNENFRALYPFSYKLMAAQADGFVRLSLEARQHFNYAKGGGLDARLFGGKLVYTDRARPRYMFKRYHFNMTGPNGYEDYTYSNYFIGRNEFEGLPSQQIMIRDGAFKIRTDLLNNKVGTSDDWLAALNLATDIPKQFNPLSILPGVRLRAFLDIGTYSGGWSKDAPTGKFLYDMGLQVNLANDLVKIYVPLLYSQVYRDYYKSTVPKEKRFWNTISFSIDIQNFRLRELLHLSN